MNIFIKIAKVGTRWDFFGSLACLVPLDNNITTILVICCHLMSKSPN